MWRFAVDKERVAQQGRTPRVILAAHCDEQGRPEWHWCAGVEIAGPSRLVFRPEAPMFWLGGRRIHVWVETGSAVRLIDPETGEGACPSE